MRFLLVSLAPLSEALFFLRLFRRAVRISVAGILRKCMVLNVYVLLFIKQHHHTGEVGFPPAVVCMTLKRERKGEKISALCYEKD